MQHVELTGGLASLRSSREERSFPTFASVASGRTSIKDKPLRGGLKTAILDSRPSRRSRSLVGGTKKGNEKKLHWGRTKKVDNRKKKESECTRYVFPFLSTIALGTVFAAMPAELDAG